MALLEPRSGQSGRLTRTPASSNDANSRISLVDQWVSRRVDEVQRASAGIDQRIELLKQAESRVIQLIESLRNETRSAEPLSRKLEAMTHDTENEVARAMKAAQEQLPRLAQIVDQQIAACRQACQGVKDELRQTALDATQLLQPLHDQSRAIVESAGAQLTAVLQPILEQTLAQAKTRLDEQVASATATMQEQFEQMAQQAKAQLGQEIQLHVQAAVVNAKGDLAEDLEQHQRELADTLAKAQSHYDSHLSRLHELAQASEVQSDACLQNVQSQHAQAVADLEKHRTALEKMLSRRMEELEQTSQGYVAQFEQRLTDRLRATKAGYQTQIDSAIRELRGHSQTLSESLSSRLHDELARLQGEADTQLSWMEERMQQRIDRLTEQARVRTGQQILQLEAASQVIRSAAHAPEPAAPEQVEVSIHLPGSRHVDSRPVG